jgi:hypothetical protein
MISAGELTVRIGVREAAVAAVDIESTRPAVAEQLLSGKSVDEAVALVPRLFAVCGRAQGLAAQLAATASAASEPDAATVDAEHGAAIEAALQSEVIHDSLWRALIDWPRALGGEADSVTLAAARAALAAEDRPALRAIVERELLDDRCDAWLEGDLCALERWADESRTPAARMLAEVFTDDPRQGASDTPLLPSYADEATAETITANLFLDADFERLPHWAGRPAETGALARTQTLPRIAAAIRSYGCGTLTRLLARLTELAHVVVGRAAIRPMAGRRALGEGRGIGWSETARGAVLHLIERTRSNRVLRYRIVAPTEWNFHPQGALTQGLLGTAAGDSARLERRAARLIGALDPCVSWRLELGHA